MTSKQVNRIDRAPRPQIDGLVLAVSLGVTVIGSAMLFLFEGKGVEIIEALFHWTTTRLGQVFIHAGMMAPAFLLLLALSPFRRLRLGPEGEAPQHSTISWAGMIFSTGIGTTVLYWGTIEWIGYVQAPPFEAPPDRAREWAMSYGMFHWGLVGWAFYALPAVCLSFAYHIRRAPSPSLAQACAPVLKHRVTTWPGRSINTIFMIGLIGSASTGIGLTTPLMTESVVAFLGLERSFTFTLLAVILIVALISISVSMGLERGIKRLSNLNLSLSFLLLGFVYLAGPTEEITRQGLRSILFMVTHFPEMIGWYYPERNKGFTEQWTVFYWAWWIAFAPFVGLFICKISRGRTMGQLIWGVLLFGTLGCTLCFVILGGYASFLEDQTPLALIDTFTDNPHAAVIQVITSLPLGKWILPFFFLLCLSFAATTYDSASYTLAAAGTARLPVDQDPARGHRVLWAVALGILPLAILSLGQKNDVLVALQTASVVVAVPMIAVTLLMVLSLLIDVRKHGVSTRHLLKDD